MTYHCKIDTISERRPFIYVSYWCFANAVSVVSFYALRLRGYTETAFKFTILKLLSWKTQIVGANQIGKSAHNINIWTIKDQCTNAESQIIIQSKYQSHNPKKLKDYIAKWVHQNFFSNPESND